MKEITTKADELVALVNLKGKISVRKAAKLLSMSEEKIEEWADYLEKQGLIKLKFRFFHLDLISKDKKKLKR